MSTFMEVLLGVLIITASWALAEFVRHMRSIADALDKIARKL